MSRPKTIVFAVILLLCAVVPVLRIPGVEPQVVKIQAVEAKVVEPQVVDQSSLSQQFLTDNFEAQLRALDIARKIEPQEVNPELRGALINALDRAGQTVTKRTEGVQRGEDPEVFGDPANFVFRVIPVVWALGDPAAIAALTAVLEFQPASYEALASFGETAVPALVSAVTSPKSRPGQIYGGLIALRFIVEASAANPLTLDSRHRIRRVAEQFLTEKDQVGGELLPHAIDLAVALDDPGLRRIVESLATDPNALAARGVEDPRRIQQMQKQAADRLRGLPSGIRPQGIARFR